MKYIIKEEIVYTVYKQYGDGAGYISTHHDKEEAESYLKELNNAENIAESIINMFKNISEVT